MDPYVKKAAMRYLGLKVDQSDCSIEMMLDDAVHDTASQMASGINNAGVESQLEYLGVPLTPEDIATSQGWDDSAMLVHCMEYISNQQSDDAFIDFLRQAADDENNQPA